MSGARGNYVRGIQAGSPANFLKEPFPLLTRDHYNVLTSGMHQATAAMQKHPTSVALDKSHFLASSYACDTLLVPTFCGDKFA